MYKLFLTLAMFLVSLAALSAEYEFSANPLTPWFNSSCDLEFSLKNPKPVLGFQTDITLPNGIIPDLENARVSERCVGHTIRASKQADGRILVTVLDFNKKAISGNSGVVFTIPIETEIVYTGQLTMTYNLLMVEGETAPVFAPDYIVEFTTSVEDIMADCIEGEAVYYDLMGRRVDNPISGVYIRHRGTTAEKVVIR